MIKKELRDILEKEMDRKDYLKYLGVGLMAIVGLTSAAKAVTSFHARNETGTRSSNTGYGSSSYGG